MTSSFADGVKQLGEQLSETVSEVGQVLDSGIKSLAKLGVTQSAPLHEEYEEVSDGDGDGWRVEPSSSEMDRAFMSRSRSDDHLTSHSAAEDGDDNTEQPPAKGSSKLKMATFLKPVSATASAMMSRTTPVAVAVSHVAAKAVALSQQLASATQKSTGTVARDSTTELICSRSLTSTPKPSEASPKPISAEVRYADEIKLKSGASRRERIRSQTMTPVTSTYKKKRSRSSPAMPGLAASPRGERAATITITPATPERKLQNACAHCGSTRVAPLRKTKKKTKKRRKNDSEMSIGSVVFIADGGGSRSSVDHSGDCGGAQQYDDSDSDSESQYSDEYTFTDSSGGKRCVYKPHKAGRGIVHGHRHRQSEEHVDAHDHRQHERVYHAHEHEHKQQRFFDYSMERDEAMARAIHNSMTLEAMDMSAIFHAQASSVSQNSVAGVVTMTPLALPPMIPGLSMGARMGSALALPPTAPTSTRSNSLGAIGVSLPGGFLTPMTPSFAGVNAGHMHARSLSVTTGNLAAIGLSVTAAAMTDIQRANLLSAQIWSSKYDWLQFLLDADHCASGYFHGMSLGNWDYVFLVGAMLFNVRLVVLTLTLALFLVDSVGAWLWLNVCSVLTMLCTQLVKSFFRRPRPGAQTIAPKCFVFESSVATFSFPSGDTSMCSGFVLCHVLIAYDLWSNRWPTNSPRQKIVWAMLSLVPWTALGRVYFGCHYWIDTLGGALLGAAVTFLLFVFLKPSQVDSFFSGQKISDIFENNTNF